MGTCKNPSCLPLKSRGSLKGPTADTPPPTPPHSPALSSSPCLPSVRHPPLNFNTCQCSLPPHRLRTCCSSHSRMLFGVAVTAGTVLHPRTPQPRPPLFFFFFFAGGCCKHTLLLDLGTAMEALKERSWVF